MVGGLSHAVSLELVLWLTVAHQPWAVGLPADQRNPSPLGLVFVWPGGVQDSPLCIFQWDPGRLRRARSPVSRFSLGPKTRGFGGPVCGGCFDSF